MKRLLTMACALALLIVPCIAQDAEYKPPRKWTFGSMGVALRADLEVFQGGARDEAGEIVIKEKDRLLKWNGTELKTLDDFCRSLYATKPGDIVEVELSRPCPTLEGSDPAEREIMTVKIKLADPKVAYKELYTHLDKRARSYDWRKEEAVTKGGPLRDKLWPRIEKHKLTGQWDNLLAAHEREIDLWDSYENLSSTDLLLGDPLAAHGFINAVGDEVGRKTESSEVFTKLYPIISKLLDRSPAPFDPATVKIPQAPKDKAETRRYLNELSDNYFEYIDQRLVDPELDYVRWKGLTQTFPGFQFAWRGEPGFDSCAADVHEIRDISIDYSAIVSRLGWSMAGLEALARNYKGAVDKGEQQSLWPDAGKECLIEGDAVFIQNDAYGLIAIGGEGRNVWKGGTTDVLAYIIDLGGDDEYVDCAHGDRGQRVSLVLDCGGNDHYRSTQKWGVACGMLGTAIIDDHDGNDTYECSDWGIGAAFGGVGLLIDRKGNDRYLGGTNSIGCAAYGVGGVIDLEGNDLYDSHTMSVGVGQPGGVGFVLDHAGDDRYRCNGEEPSGYGTEGEWTGWGIGCGFGWRTLACGGIGLVVDVKGNDIYDAGEFGLGCGYFMAIGAVRDMDGDDIYHSSRYGLAAAAHAGVGLFMDDKGNDTYEGKTAASIGGVWDIVTGYFYDGAGDDNYRCDGLGLGACAQNGFGIFWDAGGSDNYRGSASTIGNAGSAEYSGGRLAKNFGIFIDSGGGKDSYPRDDRKNGTEIVEQEYAIFVDE
jgi:hypothetical protein